MLAATPRLLWQWLWNCLFQLLWVWICSSSVRGTLCSPAPLYLYFQLLCIFSFTSSVHLSQLIGTFDRKGAFPALSEKFSKRSSFCCSLNRSILQLIFTAHFDVHLGAGPVHRVDDFTEGAAWEDTCERNINWLKFLTKGTPTDLIKTFN